MIGSAPANSGSKLSASVPVSTPIEAKMPTAITPIFSDIKSALSGNIALRNGLLARAVFKDEKSYIQIYDATGKIHQEKAAGTHRYIRIWEMPGSQIFYSNPQDEGILEVICSTDTVDPVKVKLKLIFERQTNGRDEMTSIVGIQSYNKTHMLVKFHSYPKLLLLTPEDLRIALENHKKINALFENLTEDERETLNNVELTLEETRRIFTAHFPNNEDEEDFVKILRQFSLLRVSDNQNFRGDAKKVELLLKCIPAERSIIALDASVLGTDWDYDFTIPNDKCVAVVGNTKLGFWQSDDKQFHFKGSKTLMADPSSMCSLGWDKKFALAYPIPNIRNEIIRLEIWDFDSQQIAANPAIKKAGTRFLDMQVLPQPPGGMALVAVAPSLTVKDQKKIAAERSKFLRSSPDSKISDVDLCENHRQQHVVFIDIQTGKILEKITRYYNDTLAAGNMGNLAITLDGKIAMGMDNPFKFFPFWKRQLVDSFYIALFDPAFPRIYQHEMATRLFEYLNQLDPATLVTEYVGFEFPPELIKKWGEASSTSMAVVSKFGGPAHVGVAQEAVVPSAPVVAPAAPATSATATASVVPPPTLH
jgi:hypothetical protein